MITAVLEKCAGLDVHRDSVMACLMWGPLQGETQSETRRYGTTVPELEQLKAWLEERDCHEVVMESTGPYWEPVYNILAEEWEQCLALEKLAQEGKLEEQVRPSKPELEAKSIRATLANPQEVKNRRGHKTDKKDAWWLAHLFRHGMVRASYLPMRSVRQLRMLTRQRREKIRNLAQEKNRVQKTLEQGNVKLRSVLTDVFGASGEAMLQAMILNKETDPVKIAALAKGKLRKKKEQIRAALEGHRLPETHRFLVQEGLEHMAVLVEQIQVLDCKVEEKIQTEGFQQAYQNLQTIPGVKETAAAEALAEVGPDVKAFPSAANLSSWAGECPGNHESAGKRKTGRTTKGNPYFRAMLNQSAWAASHKQGSEFEARYQHLSPRLKHKGAIIGVAHALVFAIYDVLHWKRSYQPPKATGLDRDQTQKLIRHHSRRLRKLQAWLPQAPVLSDCAQVVRKLERLGV